MEEIIRFVMLAQNLTELCEQFGMSRKTGCKHLERYAADGLKGLQLCSHRPHRFPQPHCGGGGSPYSCRTAVALDSGAQETAQGFGGQAWPRVAAGPQHHR